MVRRSPRVGDAVEGRYGGGDTWYTGVVRGVDEVEGVFAIDYDDGDTEDMVAPT